MFSGSPLFILTLTCLTKDAENVSKMLKPRLEKVAAAPIRQEPWRPPSRQADFTATDRLRLYAHGDYQGSDWKARLF